MRPKVPQTPAQWSYPGLPRFLKCLFIGLWLSTAMAATAAQRPLKVFILAGQSNMEGHAKVETFDYIGDDPATVPLLRMMGGAEGKPTVCENVWTPRTRTTPTPTAR